MDSILCRGEAPKVFYGLVNAYALLPATLRRMMPGAFLMTARKMLETSTTRNAEEHRPRANSHPFPARWRRSPRRWPNIDTPRMKKMYLGTVGASTTMVMMRTLTGRVMYMVEAAIVPHQQKR